MPKRNSSNGISANSKPVRSSTTLKNHMKPRHTKKRPNTRECKVCAAVFATHTGLLQHELVHSDEKPFACEQCDHRSKCKSDLVKHVRWVHEKRRPYKCDFCDKSFGSAGNLRKHRRWHTGEKPFQCDQCEYKSAHSGHLKEHIDRCHNKDQPKKYNCDVCTKKFLTMSGLGQHKRIHRRTTKSFACAQCPFKTKFNNDLTKHIKRVHLKLRPYKCEFCGKGFTTKKDLTSHERTHTGEKPFACEQCDYKTAQLHQLNKHVENRHNEKRTKKYECDVCAVMFFTKHNLKMHKRTHDDAKPLECDHCEYRTNMPFSLKSHINRVHSGRYSPKFECDICKKKFETTWHVKKHRTVHSDEKPFGCDRCEFRSKTEKQIAQHVRRVHDKVRPYKCEVCDKTFTGNSNLQVHRRTHTGEKPFACEFCRRKYASKKSMDMHVNIKHEIKHGDEKPFVCEKCDFRSKWRGCLRKHIKVVHQKIRPFKCKDCGKVFSQNGNLVLHRRTHTKEKPFACVRCDRKFAIKGHLKNHMRVIHEDTLPSEVDTANAQEQDGVDETDEHSMDIKMEVKLEHDEFDGLI